jgi:hypothetical protein
MILMQLTDFAKEMKKEHVCCFKKMGMEIYIFYFF